MFIKKKLHVSVTTDHHWANIQYLKGVCVCVCVCVYIYIYKSISLILLCGIPQVHNYYNNKTVKFY